MDDFDEFTEIVAWHKQQDFSRLKNNKYSYSTWIECGYDTIPYRFYFNNISNYHEIVNKPFYTEIGKRNNAYLFEYEPLDTSDNNLSFYIHSMFFNNRHSIAVNFLFDELTTDESIYDFYFDLRKKIYNRGYHDFYYYQPREVEHNKILWDFFINYYKINENAHENPHEYVLK